MLDKHSTTEIQASRWLSLQQKTRKGFTRRWYVNKDWKGWKRYLLSGTVSRECFIQKAQGAKLVCGAEGQQECSEA